MYSQINSISIVLVCIVCAVSPVRLKLNKVQFFVENVERLKVRDDILEIPTECDC